jgi:hypothetical protein
LFFRSVAGLDHRHTHVDPRVVGLGQHALQCGPYAGHFATALEGGVRGDVRHVRTATVEGRGGLVLANVHHRMS